MAIETEKAIVRTYPDESGPILQQGIDSKIGQTLRFRKNPEIVALASSLRNGGVKRNSTTTCTNIPADTPPPRHIFRSADARETLDVRTVYSGAGYTSSATAARSFARSDSSL